MTNDKHKIICAIDTGNKAEAISMVKRLAPYCGAFKIGHGLTLPNGLGVIDELQDAGADRIFLDLKFHDIPNSVAVAVREAARKGVWMLTLHLSGGPAMITAAAEEAKLFGAVRRPLLVGVSVLTSLSEHHLHEHLGVNRSLHDQIVSLSQLGVECGLDGVVCSVHEAKSVREVVGRAVIVTPGIRAHDAERQDQSRVGDGQDALEAGADYLVVGRALTAHPDPEEALAALRL
ncbi:orotidine-5'-phosphate decarboxylase [Kamptonema cortianum]|nr:orotidine-5'-phosphate decarboxylase [Geitlerinema splendidum]MDK3156171.1 orotidine-5'-phosphate decarboxylase [Kamptonema cortianum]